MYQCHQRPDSLAASTTEWSRDLACLQLVLCPSCHASLWHSGEQRTALHLVQYKYLSASITFHAFRKPGPLFHLALQILEATTRDLVVNESNHREFTLASTVTFWDWNIEVVVKCVSFLKCDRKGNDKITTPDVQPVFIRSAALAPYCVIGMEVSMPLSRISWWAW